MGLKGVAQKGKGVADKGKAVADKASPVGKRKRSDDGKKSGRLRSNPEVLRFFEDSADASDDSDSSDISDYFKDFMEEDFGLGENVDTEAGKSSSIPFIPKEEEMDEEEFGRMMGDGYNDVSQSASYAEGDHENKRSTDRSSRMPFDDDAVIWKVKCSVGRERFLSFCLMQKFVDLKALGKKMQIISAFALDHVKGFLFIESDKQNNVNEACYGLTGIYASRAMPVPKNEISRLFSIRPPKNEISTGMWVRLKNGKYKGDLAQVVHVSNPPRKAVVKLIPRIDLQAMAEKYGGGATAKRVSNPAPRLINSSELEEFLPLIQTKKDRDTGMIVQVLDGMMIKDGYLFKKVAIDSISCFGVVPSEEEVMKFSTSKNNEPDNAEWLSQLYGEQKKKRSIRNDPLRDRVSSGSVAGGKGESSGSVAGGKGEFSGSVAGGKGESSGSFAGGKGEGSGSIAGGKGECSESISMNSFEVHDLVCVGRRDFGVIIGVEKDDSYKILKEGREGPMVVTVQQSELKNEPSDMKFTALDHRMKTIGVTDTVKVMEGPLEGKQGIVKKIYRGIVFMYDENETENCGYFCCKSRICERVKHTPPTTCNEKGGESSFPSFDDFPSSPKSPLSPKKQWQSRDDNRNFNQTDKDGIFNIGQTLRIRIGPLKGYLCRVIAIRRSDVTVKLNSKQKILTVKSEHLSEVRGSSSVVLSEDPESSFLKPFDLLGGEGLSSDWAGGAGTSGAGDGWTSGGGASERSSWTNLSTPGSSSMQWESGSANDAGADNNANKGVEDAWGKKVTSETSVAWGAQAADKDGAENEANEDVGGAWGSKVTSKTNIAWGAQAADKVGAENDANKDVEDAWGSKATSKTNDAWGAQAADKVDGCWGKKDNDKALDSSNGASASWEKNINVHDNQDSGKAVEEPWGKGKNISENSAGSWGAATTKKNQLDSWGNSKSVADDKVSDDSSSWGSKASFLDKKNSGKFGSSDNDDSRDAKKSGWNSGSGEESVWGKKTNLNSESGGNNENQDSVWGKKSSWNAESGGVSGNQDSGWGKKSENSDNQGMKSDNSNNQDSVWGKKNSWNAESGGVSGNQDSGWGKKSENSDNQDSVWGKKSSWNAESGGVSGNQDSGWGKKSENSDNQGMKSENSDNQDSVWGKKSSWNAESGGVSGNQDSGWGKKSDNSDNMWGKKSSWNAESGGVSGNQDTAWGKKSDWNSESSGTNWSSGSGFKENQSDFGDDSKRSGGNWRGGFGGRSGDRGGYRGRGGDRGGYRGRGGDRGGYGGRGGDRGGYGGRGGDRGGYGGRGGDRGDFGGRGGDRGGFGGRGRSDRGGFRGRGGSDRGGGAFGGRGRGRRDWQDGTTSNVEDWNTQATPVTNESTEAWGSKSWGSGGGSGEGNTSKTEAWGKPPPSKSWGSGDGTTNTEAWGKPPSSKSWGSGGGSGDGTTSKTEAWGKPPPSKSWGSGGGCGERTTSNTEAWGKPPSSKSWGSGGGSGDGTTSNTEAWGKPPPSKSWGSGGGSGNGSSSKTEAWGKPPPSKSWGSSGGSGDGTTSNAEAWGKPTPPSKSWNSQPIAADAKDTSDAWGKPPPPKSWGSGGGFKEPSSTAQAKIWNSTESNSSTASGGWGSGSGFKEPSSTAQAGSWNNQGSESNAAKDTSDASGSTDSWGKPPSKSWGSDGGKGGW
ncbi:hypothetical protein CsatB_011370 [Cannabis sativa]